MEVKYDFNKNNEFVIEGYDKAKTFASFLPGIAGVDGIPMWSFYVNRGQCMASFGVKDKDSTIMEFFPANTMYKNIELQGFRTFIKYQGEIHEIFSSISKDNYERKMIIEQNILKIQEINLTLSVTVVITYFIMPKENFAAIVRKVEINNLSSDEKEIEVLDGLTQILPFGVKNSEYQQMSNLYRSWFDVFNLENNIAYYKLRSTAADSAQVGEINKGNFYLSFCSESKELIKPIIDMDIIFGSNTSLTRTDGWSATIDDLYKKKQIPQNKVSGGFSGAKTILKDKFSLYTIIGNTSDIDSINNRTSDFTPKYIEIKEKQARDIIDELVKDTYTKTTSTLFDKYVDQCYLDNILRGGYPLIYNGGDRNHVYHVYSRKHGDLEREYNFFSTEPSYYSQGNGNFRDVNQNRRSDILFNPKVGDYNVKQFMSLIQADGYNPLSVKGSSFSLKVETIDKILIYVKLESCKDEIHKIVDEKFTPGQLISYIVDNNVELSVTKRAYLDIVLENSNQNIEAEFGEGYWSDHWTYNMDLVDSYVKIFPDKLETFLFETKDYRFFFSPANVLPRKDKYVIVDGKVRQYGSVIEDRERFKKLKLDTKDTNWLKTGKGFGEIYECNLYLKLISLSLIKFLTLDPFGMGIEMEANKPGWNDAMNGLPGLFGSGIGETTELMRIVEFVVQTSSDYSKEVLFPIEIKNLLTDTIGIVKLNLNGMIGDFEYWDKTSSLREDYRENINYGIDGREENLNTKEVLKIFELFKIKLEKGLEKSLKLGKGIYPTFITYEASNYTIIENKTNPVNGYQNVDITEFNCNLLPLFLEAPAKSLKIIKDKEKARDLYIAIKASEIYDKKLKMYKTSVTLDATTNEIGRARAFTAGWLEREAVFLHMEYKYLLGLLNAGLYDEYYEDIKTALVPFLNPEVYGRSILENCSFIASSVNPDEAVHGRGYIARLSGSTAEFLSMWFTMMVGEKVFSYEDGELKLTLNPILPGWLFDEFGEVSFTFLSNIKVTYHNAKMANTYGDNGVSAEKTVIINANNETIEITGSVISGEYAKNAREGKIKSIDVYLF